MIFFRQSINQALSPPGQRGDHFLGVHPDAVGEGVALEVRLLVARLELYVTVDPGVRRLGARQTRRRLTAAIAPVSTVVAFTVYARTRCAERALGY